MVLQYVLDERKTSVYVWDSTPNVMYYYSIRHISMYEGICLNLTARKTKLSAVIITQQTERL